MTSRIIYSHHQANAHNNTNGEMAKSCLHGTSIGVAAENFSIVLIRGTFTNKITFAFNIRPIITLFADSIFSGYTSESSDLDFQGENPQF